MNKLFARISGVLCAAALILSAAAILPACKKSAARDKCEIVAEYQKGKICGKTCYTYTNNSDNSFKEIKFCLYANAYRAGSKYAPVEASAKETTFKEGYGGIKITYAKANGKEAAFKVCGEDENVLAVEIPELFPSEKITVEAGFETTLPKAALRLGETGKTVNLGDFYPVLCKEENGAFKECAYSPFGDPYYSDCADYSVTLTVPSTYTVASSGYPENTKTDNEKTTYAYSLSGGRDFAFVLSEDFRVASVRSGDVTVNAYTTGENAEELAAIAKNALEYFSSVFGAYPYKTFSVAVTPFNCGGMEYSGMCFLSDELKGDEMKYALVHEVAHEWWHCLVGSDQINAAYIDEGLAEFSAYLYLKNAEGNAEAAEKVYNGAIAAYKAFFDIEKTLSGSADSAMNRNLQAYSSRAEYVAISYDKSLIMFVKYSLTVGETKAVKLLKRLARDYAYGNIDLTALTKTLGLKEFFVSFVEGKVLI